MNDKNEEQLKKNPETATEKSPFPELDELQAEIQKRIRDNERFLEGFLDESYQDENGIDNDDEDEGNPEEL